MPAPVVVVASDPVVRARSAAAIRRAGHEVATFCRPMKFLAAMEAAKPGTMRVLVTDVATFPAGEPHGVAIAQMAAVRRPGLRVAFTVGAKDVPDTIAHTSGIGEIVDPSPVRVLAAVVKMMATP